MQPSVLDKSSICQRNNVKLKGNGSQTIMLAHGFGCDQSCWQFILPYFDDRYNIVLFDYVGSGHADSAAYDASKYSTLAGYKQDVLEICEALQLKDVIFIGHSVSSMIGVLAALEKPQYFKKLVLIGPSPRYLNDINYFGGFERQDLDALFDFMENNYMGWSSFISPEIVGNKDRPELGRFLDKSFRSNNPEMVRNFAHATFYSDNRADLPMLKVESLTLQCSEDIIAPEVVGQYVHQHTPNNTFVQLKATGHCPHLSEPRETFEAIAFFIS